MNVKEASRDRLNGSELRSGDFIIVEFDDQGPCAWLSSDTYYEADP